MLLAHDSRCRALISATVGGKVVRSARADTSLNDVLDLCQVDTGDALRGPTSFPFCGKS